MRSRRFFCHFLAAVAVVMLPLQLRAYNLSGQRWSGATVSMQLQLGASNGTLLDGSTSWGAAAEDALAAWNSNLTNVHFTVVRDSTAPIARTNNFNNVFWSSTVYGDAWDSRTLAITLSNYSTKTHFYSESDVLFNNTLTWNSYRGALRSAGGGNTLYDFHRVAMHEFGHVLGLNHPDDIGQTVVAIMNAATSNTDALTADDIAGARAIYDSATAAPASYLAFNGSVSYASAGSNLNLRAASVQNVGNAASGTVRLELWAMPVHYADGLPVGSKNLGTYTFSQVLPAGTNFASVNVNTTYTPPPNGTYFVALLLTEFTGGSGTGYSIRDAVEFTNTLVIGNGINAPAIATQPADQNAKAGDAVSLTVSVTGTTPGFQWFKNGVLIPGATDATLTFPSVQISDAGSYTVTISNSSGTVTSSAATLTVAGVIASANPGRLINLSVLTTISAAVPNFTVATVLGPTSAPGSRPLLVRAVGPSLSQLGVPNLLSDPKVDLFFNSSVLASNDNWGGTAPLHTAITQTGAFPLLSDTSKDAAIYAPAAASGSYSVVVSGTNGATGNVIAEIYDGAAGTFSAGAPRLVNVSVLQNIAANSTLTLGFTVGGSAPLKVLIRAIGPGLAQLGVPGPMADPQLTLFNSASQVIKSNDNWSGDADIAAAEVQTGAFAISNTASKDAMLLVTLAPGGYTAQATGVGGSSGFAIVEVYEVP